MLYTGIRTVAEKKNRYFKLQQNSLRMCFESLDR